MKKDKGILSTKDLVFKERLNKKLMKQYIGLYIIKEVVSINCQNWRFFFESIIYYIGCKSRLW